MPTNVKKKRRRSNQYTKLKLPIEHQGTKEQKIWKSITTALSPTGKICAGFVLFLTIVVAWYTFTPQISITYSNSLNTLHPFATPFTICNNSLLSVNDITFKCSVHKMISENGGTVLGKNFFLMRDVPPIPHLESKECTTFFIPDNAIYIGPISYVDVDILTSYRPALTPFHQKKYQRFDTVKSIDGILNWKYKASSE